MPVQTENAFLDARIFTPREKATERASRLRKSQQVARQMLNNGCCSNTVMRQTGLKEEQLRSL